LLILKRAQQIRYCITFSRHKRAEDIADRQIRNGGRIKSFDNEVVIMAIDGNPDIYRELSSRDKPDQYSQTKVANYEVMSL
jgi:hypothetical protein